MATTIFELSGTQRQDLGKGASRRLRRLHDMVPGIVYGASGEALPISIEQRFLRKALENEAFYSHAIQLTIDNQPTQVLLKALQRHPFKAIIQHVDFQRIDKNTILKRQVPLHFINESICPGIKAGGQLSQNLSSIEINCLASDLPEYIEVDLQHCAVNSTVHLSDLVLPDQVTLVGIKQKNFQDLPVLHIHLAKSSKVETAVPETKAKK